MVSVAVCVADNVNLGDERESTSQDRCGGSSMECVVRCRHCLQYVDRAVRRLWLHPLISCVRCIAFQVRPDLPPLVPRACFLIAAAQQ